MNVKPDKVDLNILSLLQGDCRSSVSEISRQIHLSQTSVAERLKRLEGSSMIMGYRAVINLEAYGYQVMALIKIITNNSEAYIAFAINQPEVIDCFSVIGEVGVVMRVLATDNAHLQRLIAKISKFGATSTSTTIIVGIDLPGKIISLPTA